MKYCVLMNDNVKEFPTGYRQMKLIESQFRTALPVLKKHNIKLKDDYSSPFIPLSFDEKRGGIFQYGGTQNLENANNELERLGFHLEEFADKEKAQHFWFNG